MPINPQLDLSEGAIRITPSDEALNEMLRVVEVSLVDAVEHDFGSYNMNCEEALTEVRDVMLSRSERDASLLIVIEGCLLVVTGVCDPFEAARSVIRLNEVSHPREVF